MKTQILAKAIGLGVALGLAGQASAAGFEKSIMFGGKTSGIAGIGTPQIQGSQALYFNPAGLAMDKDGQDVTVNLSPTWAKFKAPISAADTQQSSDNHMSLPFSLMYGGMLTEKLGIGAGVYVSGGTSAEYKDITIGNQTGSPEIKSELAITEFSLGAGYKVTDSLKLGLSWRAIMVKGDFGFMSYTPAGNINSLLKDVKGDNYAAFKIGAQYKLSESTQLGFTYRSNAPFKAKAKGTMTRNTGTGYSAIGTETDVKVAATFPDAYTLGVQHVVAENFNLYGEYVYTVYGRVKNAQVDGTLGNQSSPAIQLNWRDQTNIRLAGEYTGMGMPVRFGYVWTSQVSDNQFAKATFTPPGMAHTITLGTGKNFGEALSLDAGFEWTFAQGGGGTSSPVTVGTRGGEYEVNNYALHLGVGYNF